MEPFEERVRQSLRHHAGDVEPTSALWPEVDRRITRRRRTVAASWSLTAAAAALLGVVAVPTSLDTAGRPEIDAVDETPGVPTDETAPQATLPSSAVAVGSDGDELTLLDLATGRRTSLPAPEGKLRDVAVRPGTAPGDDLEVAYTAAAEQAGTDVVGVIDEDGDDRVVSSVPTGDVVESTVVWSPDGDWLAWSGGESESRVGMDRVDDPAGSAPEGGSARGVVPQDARTNEALPEGLILTDWAVDGLAGPVLFGAHADGYAVMLQTDLDDDPAAEADALGGEAQRMVEGLFSRVDASSARDGSEGSYALTDHGGGLELEWTTPDGSVELPLPDELGDGPFDLDAAEDAVTVSDGASAWLITHDGAGEDARVADLGDATAVSLVREAGAPAEGEDEVVVDDDREAPDWAPTLLATDAETGSRLALLDTGTDQSEDVASLDAGDGHLEAVAVQPGSTPEELTAVLLAQRDATYELRLLHVDGDDVTCCETLEDEVQVAMDGPVDGDHSIPLPVWSPSGDALAWVESAEGTNWLRTLAWDDRSPSSDASLHQRVDIGALGVETDVTLQDWVTEEEQGETRQGVLYLTDVDPEGSAVTELPVTSEQGATDVTGNAFRMGTDVLRALVDHATGIAGEPDAEVLDDPAAGRVVLEWDPGSSAWLTFGRSSDAVSLPGDYVDGLDLDQRAWLAATDHGAVTGVGRALYLVDPDGTVTPIEAPEVDVAHADVVD